MYPKLVLKHKKDTAVKRFHPWVFSGAVKSKDDNISDGDLVAIHSVDGKCLGIAHFQDGSIIARMLTFKEEVIDSNFWEAKISSAYSLRKSLGLANNTNTNAYRLIHAEGDSLPGLVIDIYGKTAVVQCHSIGMHLQRELIAAALVKVLGDSIAVYDKSKETLPNNYSENVNNSYLIGKPSEEFILENGHKFSVNWEQGQKTGFFLDQRENRNLLSKFVSGKSVLNTFCYSGGFSIYALKAGATAVHSVDASKKAILWTDMNVALNGFDEQHESYAMDTMEFFKSNKEKYDVVVVDPPAYAKSVKARHNAVQGYKRLNAKALTKVKPGGYMFTFSCSQVVSQSLFENTIVAAALETGKKVRILYRLTQPADHPVNIYHPEGNYLKGLVLYVE